MREILFHADSSYSIIKMQAISSLTSSIIDAIAERKGQKITYIDLSDIEGSSAPAFVICQGRSSTQVNGIADNVIDRVNKDLNVKPYHTDGFRNSQWIVVDYGSVVVHVFQPEVREFYNLEELWSDGEFTEFPELED